MRLLTFFKNEAALFKPFVVFMTVVSGVANISVLIVLHDATDAILSPHEQMRAFLIYFTFLILFLLSKRYSSLYAANTIQTAIRKLRLRIANKITQLELLFIENRVKTDIYMNLTQDINLISQSAINMMEIIVSLATMTGGMLYIAWIYPLAFPFMAIGMGLAFIYLFKQRMIHEEVKLSIKKEKEFVKLLSQVLEGFKEIKIHESKKEALLAYIETIAIETEQVKASIGRKHVMNRIVPRTLSFLVLGVLVFVLPFFGLLDNNAVLKIMVIIVFLMRTVEGLARYSTLLSVANGAISDFQRFEAELDEQLKVIPDYHAQTEQWPQTQLTSFEEIQMKEITFEYSPQTDNEYAFKVGPLNLTIQQGEIIFIIGGNGSGKSTLMKLLTGLYYPQSGQLILDNQEMELLAFSQYRSLFSTIFTDFYLFDRLHGVANVDDKKLGSLLSLMKLNKKTEYRDNQFTDINLSTGQRKRLALITTLMEDRPICIFDEWAADQDPTFRKYFYEELLEDLKKQGKTIIAVTHDDRYFHLADKVVKMEYGQIVPNE